MHACSSAIGIVDLDRHVNGICAKKLLEYFVQNQWIMKQELSAFLHIKFYLAMFVHADMLIILLPLLQDVRTILIMALV